MQSKEFKNIGETVYGTTLSNGLRLRVIPKRGFSTCYAVFATNYGGAHRRFAIDGRIEDTPAGVAHFLRGDLKILGKAIHPRGIAVALGHRAYADVLAAQDFVITNDRVRIAGHAIGIRMREHDLQAVFITDIKKFHWFTV